MSVHDPVVSAGRRVNVLKRWRPDDHPTIAEAERDLERAHVRRAVDDPAAVARAARIVRAALARQALSLADLTPLPRDNGTTAA